MKWFGAWLVVVFWTNTHGSFILAPILSTVYAAGVWVDERLPPSKGQVVPSGGAHGFLLFSIASLGATLVNPVGVELLKFVFDFGHGDQAKLVIGEWLPTFDPRWRGDRGFWIGIGCASLTAVLMVTRWRKLSAVDVLLFLVFITLAVQAIRFLVYLGMVAAFIVPRLVPIEWNAAQYRTRSYAAVACIGATVLGLSMKFGNALGAFPHSAFEANYSLSTPMLRQLENCELRGNVINSYELGAELVYRAYPRLRPSIDSRIDSYGPHWTALNARLFLDDNLLNEFVNHYQVRYMLLSHDDFISLQRLPNWSENRWLLRAMDRRTVLLQRGDVNDGERVQARCDNLGGQ